MQRLTLGFFCVILVSSAKLPSYMSKCDLNIPDLEECLVKSGNAAIPHLVKGIEEFGIPVLDPLYIPFVSIKASNNLELNFTDLVVKGLKDSHVLSHKILTEGNNSLMRIKLAIKLLEMEGHYKIDGNILILPVQGEGETKLVMEDVLVWVMINYTIVDGLFHSQDLSSRTVPQHATFRFHNLFNGDKQLGDQVNEFLNENAMSVLQDISPFLDQTINRIIDDLQRKLTSNIPMNEIFLNYV